MAAVLLEIRDNIGFITLNREDKMNAFNREMALALQLALDNCRDDTSVRAIYITGKGKAFSAGQDLAEVADPNATGFDKILTEQYNPIISRIRNIPLPVVAAVNGVAAGAGANIALCCDVIIAGRAASFIQAFTKIGLIPDSGGTYFLPRLIGWQRASALMMLGEKISAADAEQMGMIYKMFDDDKLVEQGTAIAKSLAQMPTQALALTKDALNHSVVHNLDEQLNYEDKLQSIAGRTSDFMEGMRAFIQKRKPLFTGK